MPSRRRAACTASAGSGCESSRGAPIFGCGGVATWEDAAEFFTVGAAAVQVGTAAAWEGAGLIGDLTAGLEAYLESRGYKSHTDITGKALPNIAGFNKLDLDYKMVATLIE